MTRKRALKEIPWGFGDFDQTMIYTNGHVAPGGFLRAVKDLQATDVPQESREALVLDDVQHIRVRRLSPSEARQRGVDWGYMKEKMGRIKLTAVFV